jgi:hypothetical protein
MKAPPRPARGWTYSLVAIDRRHMNCAGLIGI